MTKKRNPYSGSSLESWLDEAGIREEVTVAAIKSVIAHHLATEMKKRKLSKKRMAELMNVSRAQIDRILTALVTRCLLRFRLQSKRSNVLLLARSPAPQPAGFIKALFPNWSH